MEDTVHILKRIISKVGGQGKKVTLLFHNMNNDSNYNSSKH